jgi:hypothetical protein
VETERKTEQEVGTTKQKEKIPTNRPGVVGTTGQSLPASRSQELASSSCGVSLTKNALHNDIK